MTIPEPTIITAAAAPRTNTDGVVTERAIDADTVGAPELVFGRFDIAPHVDLAPHIHSADTVAYCIRGTCSFRVGHQLDRTIEMGPGDYVYIPAATVHTETTGNEGVELIFARDRRGGQTTFRH